MNNKDFAASRRLASNGLRALNRRRAWMGSAAGGAVLAFTALSASISAPTVALAQDECGVAPVGGGTVTCTAANNPYANGITYVVAPGDLTIDLQPGVAVNTSGSLNIGVLGLQIGADSLNVNGFTSNASISTTDDGAFGVLGATDDGALTVGIGRVTTTGVNATGIEASSATGLTTVTAGTITTSGAGANGISANTNSGAVNVTATTINTTGAGAEGIMAHSDTAPVTVNAGTITTTGAGSLGIDASGGGGAVTVTGTNIQTSGPNAAGIRANGFGPISVTAGRVAATGTNSAGVFSTTTGTNSLTVNGAGVSSTSGDAVTLTGSAITVSTATGSTIAGQTAGIRSTSTGSTTMTLRGTIASAGGFAVDATGGPATITNSGTVNGRVRLSANNDTFTNSGTFNQTGSSDLGAGADTFNNSGTFNASTGMDFGVGADVFNNSGALQVLPGAAPVGSVTFAGLETFNNTGLVGLQNGRAGDSLVIPGTFNGSGASRLNIDVANSGGVATADRLVITSATGSTVVGVNNTGAGLFTPGVVIVDGSAASPSTAFTLASANATSGFAQYGIVYDPATFNFSLVGTPRAAAFETAMGGEIVAGAWRKSSDAWDLHMLGLRDMAPSGEGPSSGGHVWGEVYGGSEGRDSQRTFTTFNVTNSFDLSYDQYTTGFQGGADYMMAFGSGSAVLGVTAGGNSSDITFGATGDTLELRGGNIGAYAGFQIGGLFINGLVKYDRYDVDTDTSSVGSAVSFKASAYGARSEIGYRWQVSSFFIEPAASLTYIRTDLDDYTTLQSTVDNDSFDSLRGKAGVRIGGAWNSGAMGRVVPYVGVYAVHEYRGKDGVVFNNNGFALPIDDTAPGDFGQVIAGLDFQPMPGLSAFVQGDGNFGGDVDGSGLQVGVRFKW